MGSAGVAEGVSAMTAAVERFALSRSSLKWLIEALISQHSNGVAIHLRHLDRIDIYSPLGGTSGSHVPAYQIVEIDGGWGAKDLGLVEWPSEVREC